MADWNKLAKYMPTGVFLTFQSLVTLTTHKPDAKPDALGCAATAALLHCHAVCPSCQCLHEPRIPIPHADLVWPMPLTRSRCPPFHGMLGSWKLTELCSASA